MKNIQKINILLRRNTYAFVAAELIFAILLTALPEAMGHSAAYGQLTSRSITMSDSGPSGVIASGEGSGLNVDYKVTFTPVSGTSIAGIVIDFCSGSPIIGDTSCGAIGGFNTNYSTLTVSNQTGLGANTFTVSSSSSTSSKVVLTRTASAGSGAASFELGATSGTGFTNPSSTGTFYARIYTYSTAAGATGYTLANPSAGGTILDAGGVALSIASVITITARVQESLIFCMSAAAPSSNCGGTSAPSITLGHGSTGKVIDSTAIDTGTVYSQLSTNAVSGAIVRIHINNSCGGLSADGGSTCGIPPVNSGSATTPNGTTVPAMAAGTAAFGLDIATGSGGTGTVSPGSPYNGTGTNYYGMDSTTSNNNVTTGFGSPAESSSAPCSNVNNAWTFAATASNVTPAGLYAANIAAIATGTF